MSESNKDRRVVLIVLLVMVALVALTAVFARSTRDDDVQPTTYNSGSHGWKGAYILLGQLGYTVRRSDVSAVAALDGADAPHTTYLLASPNLPAEDVQRQDYEAVERFLRRGGRVVAAGANGASFLPDGRTGRATQLAGELCNSVPEGNGTVAQSGSVSTYDAAPWTAPEPLVRVDARCGADAVLVHRDYANGGRMVYLSSPEPFSNRGLRQNNALQLLLVVAGAAKDHRTVLFDEFYHGVPASPSDYLRGLPLRSLVAQAALVLLLLMLSYTRRSGPIREPLQHRRTSPLEFARSMGVLYERAGASRAATEAARRRFIRFLIQHLHLPADATNASAEALAQMVAERSGSGVQTVALMDRLNAARYETLRPRDALRLVQAVQRAIDESASETMHQQKTVETR